MSADRSKHPIVHFVGSIPLPDTETVFRTLSGAVGPHLVRLPDGETGIRKTWIRFLQDVLAENPAIELAKRRAAVQVHAVGRQGAARNPAPAPQARREARRRRLQDRLRRHGDRVLGRVRPDAEGRRHPGQRQVPDLHPDADRAHLQQHGAGATGPKLLPRADAALHRRGRARSPRRCRTIASRSNGTSARRCWPGKATTRRARSISAPRRSTC